LDSGVTQHTDAPRARSRFVEVDGHEIHCTEWGAVGAPTVLLWHGLARTGRDFDPIASALSPAYHLICPDQIGRGFSQWSSEPDRDYCLRVYARIAEGLANRLGLARFHWIGTSMGGALGMYAAASNLRGRIRRLLINDIGPVLPQAAVARIRAYAATPPAFERVSDFEAWIRQIYAPFGAHTDQQWRHLATTSLRRLSDGRVTAHYDPAIVRQFERQPPDYELWAAFDALDVATLILRGAESDLLTGEIVAAMRARRPDIPMTEIAGCGHAPGLNTPSQIAIVESFLAESQQ
jgi:pimeloyl-ACP methyl ester carboxylesterase